MGHYYSEMGSSEERKKEADANAAGLVKRAEKIEAMIAEHGLARVLAMMVDDPTIFRIRTH